MSSKEWRLPSSVPKGPSTTWPSRTSTRRRSPSSSTISPAAVSARRPPEVDGLAGLRAVAGVWAVAESRARDGAVRIKDVVDGTLAVAQQPVDAALGLLDEKEMQS